MRVVATAATGNRVFVHVSEVDRDGFVGTREQATTSDGGNLLIAAESSESFHWLASAD